MKKKIILAAGMLIICSVLIYFARGFQAKTIEKLSGTNTAGSELQKSSSDDKEKTEDNGNTQNNINSTSDNHEVTKDDNTKPENTGTPTPAPTATETNNEVKPTPTPAPSSTPAPTPAPTATPTPGGGTGENSKPNLIIIDTITNRTILSVKVNYDGKTNLITYMKSELTKAGKSFDISSNGYVSMIDGLREKKSGPSSGWIYYVNGTKSVIGAGEFAPSSGSIITWKYWKDALNEKN